MSLKAEAEFGLGTLGGIVVVETYPGGFVGSWVVLERSFSYAQLKSRVWTFGLVLGVRAHARVGIYPRVVRVRVPPTLP